MSKTFGAIGALTSDLWDLAGGGCFLVVRRVFEFERDHFHTQ